MISKICLCFDVVLWDLLKARYEEVIASRIDECNLLLSATCELLQTGTKQ
jgi:hypothetical protein